MGVVVNVRPSIRMSLPGILVSPPFEARRKKSLCRQVEAWQRDDEGLFFSQTTSQTHV